MPFYPHSAGDVQLHSSFWILHSCLALPPAAGGGPLFIWTLPAHLLLAFQRVQHLCWQNSCYLRLINPYSCWEWKKIFLFAAQELCSVRSEAPLTKSVFCSSCLLQINLLFFPGIWIFFRVPWWHWVRRYCMCLESKERFFVLYWLAFVWITDSWSAHPVCVPGALTHTSLCCCPACPHSKGSSSETWLGLPCTSLSVLENSPLQP